MNYDVIVVGGGAIGLAIARTMAEDRCVLLIERGSIGRESSWAAAGMLCPQSEAEEDDPLLRLSLRSLATYRTFAAELLEETGVDIEYHDEGVLVLASDPPQYENLRRRCEWQQRARLDATMLSAEDVRRREPRLTLDIEGAMFCPGDHQIRPRRLLEALWKSCAIRGVEILEDVPVEAVVSVANHVEGVRASSGSFAAPTVILAAGAWASEIDGMFPKIRMKPRKGQILSLEMPGATFRHLIRWGRLYFVPRRDGELVVGATNEDCGFDRRPTAAGLSALLVDAQRLSSDVGHYPILETWAGLRPTTEDGLPAIGASGVEGLFYALGHYRNGILLTPVTAKIIDALTRGDTPEEELSVFSPLRFSR